MSVSVGLWRNWRLGLRKFWLISSKIQRLEAVLMISWWTYPEIRRLKLHLLSLSNKYFLPRKAKRHLLVCSKKVTSINIFRGQQSRSQVSIRRVSELCSSGGAFRRINIKSAQNFHILLAAKIRNWWWN